MDNFQGTSRVSESILPAKKEKSYKDALKPKSKFTPILRKLSSNDAENAKM